ncbi:sterol O-acyltransferase 1-like isoform X1 [Anastrepha ludens]|uniref:sterol O-acyltransferase 1-like isoform X1 n=1 Tax=Anastrepha ludens TaxID=28586 RepID=UPI0023B0F700|nr:sterol O-acyltransferase 1-like isoform X1 [Anastrepha ludens]
MVSEESRSNGETVIDIKKCDFKVENTAAKDNNASAPIQSESLREKVFKPCDSYLTDLYKSEHIKTLYNIFGVATFFLITYYICDDYFKYGRIYLGWFTIKAGFGGLQYACGCWFLINLIALLVYLGVRLWTKINSFVSKGIFRWCLNALFLLFYIIALLLGFYLCALCCLFYRLPFASATFILMETVRILMKIHAFVRTTIGQSCNSQSPTNNSTNIPSIGHYVFFLFAPTLIYRDSYPRSTVPIRWTFLLARLSEIFIISFHFIFIYERYIEYYYKDFGTTAPKWAQIVEDFYGMMLPCALILVLIMVMVLHSIQNFFAELLHFSDRRFYSNWWTATNYRVYLIRWNCLVQEWLYEYIYKDICTYVSSNRFVCSFTVITISAIMHEVMFSLALQLFLPINYICFGVLGYVLMCVPFDGRLGNVTLWVFIVFGMTLQVSLYCMEYYAKLNCPKMYSENLVDILIPHIWTCLKNHN